MAQVKLTGQGVGTKTSGPKKVKGKVKLEGLGIPVGLGIFSYQLTKPARVILASQGIPVGLGSFTHTVIQVFTGFKLVGLAIPIELGTFSTVPVVKKKVIFDTIFPPGF